VLEFQQRFLASFTVNISHVTRLMSWHILVRWYRVNRVPTLMYRHTVLAQSKAYGTVHLLIIRAAIT